ncbi:alpha-N-acetylgalactosamine-specific lectin-like [Crassostrea virginica]
MFEIHLLTTYACFSPSFVILGCSLQSSHAVCNGILFNQERKTCKLINCSPTHSALDFDPGRWTLFWKTTGMCKTGWSKHEEFCYYFNQTGDTWSNSKRMCEDNGGYLASIRTTEENSWIVDTFLPPWNYTLCSPNWWYCCEYWIGGNDLSLEGTFTWTSDNSTLGFINWYPPSEPDNNSDQDCLSICRDGHWADNPCERVWPYICKAPAI